MAWTTTLHSIIRNQNNKLRVNNKYVDSDNTNNKYTVLITSESMSKDFLVASQLIRQGRLIENGSDLSLDRACNNSGLLWYVVKQFVVNS